MKTTFLTLIALAITLISFGQAPEAFKYQAVVRDAGGIILTNQAVGYQLTILQGSPSGTAVYTETFSPTTNGYGLVNLEIGTGTTSYDFTTIDWANGPYFMETAVDITGGTSYTVMGTSQLMSVPYALYAKTSGNGAGPVGPQGPAGNDGVDGVDGVDGAVGATGPQGPQGPAGNGGVDGAVGATGPQGIQGPAGNDGAQGIPGNDGATGPQGPAGNDGVDGIQGIPGNDGVGIAQTLSQSGSDVTLSDGGGTISVNDADADPINELQILSLSNDTLYLSEGNDVYLGGIANNSSTSIHGNFAITNGEDSIWVVPAGVNFIEVDLRAGDGSIGQGIVSCAYTGGNAAQGCPGGNGGSCRILLSVNQGDNIQVVSGANGVQPAPLPGNCSNSFGANGNPGTSSQLIINSVPSISVTGGQGGIGVRCICGSGMDSCGELGFPVGANGTVSGPVLSSGVIMLESGNIGGGFVQVRY